MSVIENTLNELIDILDVPLVQLRDEIMAPMGFQLGTIFLDDGDLYIVYRKPSGPDVNEVWIGIMAPTSPMAPEDDFHVIVSHNIETHIDHIKEILRPTFRRFHIRFLAAAVRWRAGPARPPAPAEHQEGGGYVVNPATGRVVKANGRIGRKLRR